MMSQLQLGYLKLELPWNYSQTNKMHISVREDGSRTLRTIRSRPRCFLQILSSSVGHVKNNDWSHGSNPLAYWHHTTTDTCQTKLNHMLLHPTCFLVFKASIAHDLAKQIRLAAKRKSESLLLFAWRPQSWLLWLWNHLHRHFLGSRSSSASSLQHDHHLSE